MSSLHFRELGKGLPIVFLHGFCETHAIWDDFADRFAEEYRIIIPDLPGFGKSEPLPAPFSIDDVARSVIHLLESLSLSQYILVGHSLGGYVSLAMAGLRPEAIHSMVLFHSTANADTPEKKENRNKVIDFVVENGVAPFVATFVPGLFRNPDDRGIPGVRKLALQTRKDTLIDYTLAMRDRPSRVNFLAHFKKPVLLLGGRLDAIITADSLTLIASQTNAELVFLEQAAHMGMLEMPNAAYEALRKFLKREDTLIK